MSETRIRQEETLYDQIDYVKRKPITNELKNYNIKKLLLESKHPLVLDVLKGKTTFSDQLRPLIEEYKKLSPTSLITATCMDEVFMQKGDELKQKMSGFIHLGLHTEIIEIPDYTCTYCDVTIPLSRNALLKKTFEKYRKLINVFFLFTFTYLFLDTLGMYSPESSTSIKDALIFTSLVVFIIFLSTFYMSYLLEYILRKKTLSIIFDRMKELDKFALEIQD